MINELIDKILSYSYGENTEIIEKVIKKKIIESYKRKKRLEFIMPAFPGKSPNPLSCFDSLPDNTEIIAINTIENFIDEINHIYPYGCKVNIVHDGHFFMKLNITRTENELNKYIEAFRNITSNNINSITIYDLMKTTNIDIAYKEFIDKYYTGIDMTYTEENLSKEILFNKFEFKNMLCKNSISKNQFQLKAKHIAKESLKIKKAVAELIDESFPDNIRLSVHYQPSNSVKMGMKLIPNAINKGTPWFYIIYKTKTDKIILGKKDWNLPGKKEIKNSYGYYYYIDDSAINLFLEGKLNDKIKKEKEYNR